MIVVLQRGQETSAQLNRERLNSTQHAALAPEPGGAAWRRVPFSFVTFLLGKQKKSKDNTSR